MAEVKFVLLSTELWPAEDFTGWQAEVGGYFPQHCKAWISDLKLPNKWDEKPQIGSHFSTMTFQGYSLPTFKLTLTAWDALGMSDIYYIMKILRPPPNPNKLVWPPPVAIKHAALSVHGITSMVVKTLIGPDFIDQMLTLSADCQMWRKPDRVILPATKTPVQSVFLGQKSYTNPVAKSLPGTDNPKP